MKRLLCLALLASGAFAATAHAQDFEDDQDGYDDPAVDAPVVDTPVSTVALDGFFDALSPYGQWINMTGLGWCWQPSPAIVGPDFRPYDTGGQWVYTTDGWEMQSQWDWGDIVFHYGRWYEDEAYGWLWVPGTDWGPSWVDWRENDQYVGWAPETPDGLAMDSAPTGWWCFVTVTVFVSPSMPTQVIPPAQVVNVLPATQPVQRTSVVNGQTWNRGPAVAAIQASGVTVTIRPSARVALAAATPQTVRPRPVSAASSASRSRFGRSRFTGAAESPTPVPAPRLEPTGPKSAPRPRRR